MFDRVSTLSTKYGRRMKSKFQNDFWTSRILEHLIDQSAARTSDHSSQCLLPHPQTPAEPSGTKGINKKAQSDAKSICHAESSDSPVSNSKQVHMIQ